MNRKNWTSSWTVLQGSTLLFAKGQGGGTSWVSDSNLCLENQAVSYQHSWILSRQKYVQWLAGGKSLCVVLLFYIKSALSVFGWFVRWLDGSWGWNFSLVHVSFSISLPSASSPPSILLVFIPLRPSMQPYYHSGSFPEFLLSLLSNWRPSAQKRAAVSYGCSELHRASSVCASSFLCVPPSLLCMPPPSSLSRSDPNPSVCD